MTGNTNYVPLDETPDDIRDQHTRARICQLFGPRAERKAGGGYRA